MFSILGRAALIVLLGCTVAQAAAPRVVTSTKPVHALVSAVMKDVAKPDLLLSGAASAHSYSLRPADAKMLSAAEVVFWIGPEFETFLNDPLQTLAVRAQPVELLKTPGLARRPLRDIYERGISEKNIPSDPHAWLDPDNAIVMAVQIAEVLMRKDPENAQRYRANTEALATQIMALDEELRKTLTPVKTVPFITYHDAYQYFEGRYGLTSRGAVTASPEMPTDAGRRTYLELAIKKDVACIFSEPQFEPKIVKSLIEGTSVRTGVLDPEGSKVAPGPEAYFTLMRNLAADYMKCLKP